MTIHLPNNTARLFVDYTVCGVDHTSMIRFDAPNTYVDAQVEWNDVVEAVDTDLLLITIRGARVQAKDTDFSFPVDWTQQETYGTADGDRAQAADMLNFIGRSSGGTKGGFFLFGCVVKELNEKYRILSSEDPAVAAGLVELRAAEGTALAADGLQMTWQNYVNIGTNAYWRNKIR